MALSGTGVQFLVTLGIAWRRCARSGGIATARAGGAADRGNATDGIGMARGATSTFISRRSVIRLGASATVTGTSSSRPSRRMRTITFLFGSSSRVIAMSVSHTSLPSYATSVSVGTK